MQNKSLKDSWRRKRFVFPDCGHSNSQPSVLIVQSNQLGAEQLLRRNMSVNSNLLYSESRSTYICNNYVSWCQSWKEAGEKLWSPSRAIRRTGRLAPVALVHVHMPSRYVPYVNVSPYPNPSYRTNPQHHPPPRRSMKMRTTASAPEGGV
jgi:hypothetical protein